jgi:hypothetical protein
LNGTWTTEPKDESLKAMKPDGTTNGSPHQRRGNEWAVGKKWRSGRNAANQEWRGRLAQR